MAGAPLRMMQNGVFLGKTNDGVSFHIKPIVEYNKDRTDFKMTWEWTVGDFTCPVLLDSKTHAEAAARLYVAAHRSKPNDGEEDIDRVIEDFGFYGYVRDSALYGYWKSQDEAESHLIQHIVSEYKASKASAAN